MIQVQNLLREGRHQRDQPEVPVPRVCLLDPDGDVVRHLQAAGVASRHPGSACDHSELWVTHRGDQDVGIVPCVVGAPYAVLVAEELHASGCELIVSITSAGRVLPLGDPPYFILIEQYQGRIVADNILGRERVASYAGIPRVVFADPEIAAVGLTAGSARQRGIDVATAEISVPDSVDRSWTYERDPRGAMGVIVDRSRRVLVGAWAVAPLASEWIHQASLAIRADIPVDVLLDQVAQYPTYSEAYLAALERLN